MDNKYNFQKIRQYKKNSKQSKFLSWLKEQSHDLKSNPKKIIHLILILIISLFGLALIGFFLLIGIFSIGLPDVNDLDKLAIAQSTTIYDREGNILYVNFGEENREFVPLTKISKNLINATIAIEDSDFWTHSGFDMTGLARALISNAFHFGAGPGGSTITQQYIKLTFLSSERSITRKIKELILAVRLEQSFTKEQILEKYLNKIPYGNNAYGIEKAAQIYFKKPSSELTIAESAILAAIPQAPSYYNPFGPHRYSTLTRQFTEEELKKRPINSESDLKKDEFLRGLIGKNIQLDNGREFYLQGRADLVLKRLLELEYITESEFKKAQTEYQSIPFEKHRQNIKAPHFVFEVINQLEKKYGKEIVDQGGLKVYTTIDPKLQEYAESAITKRAETNEKNYNIKNSSLVALNPKTGEILAMVGSRNFWEEEIDGQTNVALSYRQPGSSYKPFVYAAAFINRFSPASIVFDVPTKFGSDNPKNYDGKFQGPISLRQALGKSRNIPAIKAYFLGGEQDAILELAEKLGVKHFTDNRPLLEFYNDPKNYQGYPLSLGTASTTLLSMVNAYATFANNGIQQDPVYILKVVNSNGETIEEHRQTEGKSAIDPQIAYLINSILSDKSVSLGENLNIPNQITAAKTGTSNLQIKGKYLPNDLLAIGYSTKIAAGVWSGNNNSTKHGLLKPNAESYTSSALIWKDFMTQALSKSPKEEFPIPEGIKQLTVSKYTGKLPAPNTPESDLITDYFASFSIPTEIDDSFTSTPDFSSAETLTQSICNPGQRQIKQKAIIHDIDPSRESWETQAQEWLKENTIYSESTGKITCEPSNSNFKISIQSPQDQSMVNLSETNELNVTITYPPETAEVQYYLNGTLRNISKTAPFNGTIILPKNSRTPHFTITARAFDQQGNISDSTTQIINILE